MPTVHATLISAPPGVPTRPRLCTCEAATVWEAVESLERAFAVRLRRPRSLGLAHGVVLFVNGSDLRFSGGPDRTLEDGDKVTVVLPATDT